MPRLSKLFCIVFGVAIGLALSPGFDASGPAASSEPSSQAYVFAPAVAPSAFAADKSDDSQDGDEEQDPEETPIDKAMRLIKKLPADPYEVTEGCRAEIEEAQAAYDALTATEQAELDSIFYGREQTYGRWLEAAQWALLSLQPLDNTLPLIDGDYSDYVMSASTMGKSVSPRSKKWTVSSLSVSDGQAWGVIRCETTSSFRFMRLGGADYVATVVDDVPEFSVPLEVSAGSGGWMTFLVAANDVSDYIAVQIQATLPLSQASADKISSAKSVAQSTLSGLDAYTDESAAALKAAADALMDAASKSGVTSVEIDVATAALNGAIANAEKKPSDDSSSGSSDKSSSGSSSKSKGSKSKGSKSSSSKSSASASSSSSAAKAPAAAASKTPSAANRASNLVAPTVSKSSSSKSSSSKSASSSSAAASTTGDDDDGGQSQQDAIEVTPSSEVDDETIAKALIAMGVLALMLLGMCARTFLFVRAKEVA